MEDTVEKRLRNSGSPEADKHTQQGTGPTRVHHNIHHKGHQKKRGEDAKGEQSYAQATAAKRDF
jgi:hypothetical protein